MADYIFPYGEAPDDANYVLSEGPNPDLPNADVLVPGANISIVVGAGTVTISSTGGGTDNATFITATDETTDLPNSFQVTAGSNIALDYVGNQLIISSSASGSGGGTVTTVISNNATPLFTTNVATPTTTPTISYTISAAASGTFFSGPASGANATANYRGILGTDLSGALTAGSNITLTPDVAPGSRLTITAVGFQPLSSVLNALASSLTGTGYVVQTGPDAFAERTFQGSTYVTITNPAGIAGDSTISLSPKVLTTDSSDLLNALSSATGTGIVARTSEEGVAFRTIQGSSNITVTNPTGIAGDPALDTTARVFTVATSSLLNALSSSTVGGQGGIYQLSDTSFINRSLTGTTGRIVITNPLGLAGAPTFDVGTDVYVTGDITALPGIQMIEAGGTLQIGASGAQGGTLTSVGNIDPLWTTNVTGPSVTYVLNQIASGALLIGPKDGVDDEPTLRRLLGQDLTDALVEGSNITLALVGDQLQISSTAGGSGTVTEVSAEDLPPLFTTLVTNETTTPNIAYTLTQQASGTFFAGPASGSIADPTFRTIVGSDVINALEAGANITITLVGDSAVIAASGSTGYTTIQEEGTPLTQRDTINFVGDGITASDDSGGARTQVSLDATLNALATYTATGLVTMTSQDVFAGREIAGTPNQVTVANGNGVAGNITVGLDSGINANLLADGSVSNTEFQYLDGASSNLQEQLNQKQPLSSTLNALSSGLSSVGYVVQTGPDVFAERTLQGTSNRLTITNPAGTAGDSVLDVGTDVLVVGDVTALPGIQIVNGTGVIQVGASGALGGTLTNLTVGNIDPVWATTVDDANTTPAVSYTLNQFASGVSLLGPKDGVDDEPTLRRMLGQDLTDALAPGSNVTITLVGDQLEIASSGSGSGYDTIQEEGTPLTQRSTVNFTGAGITAFDDSGNSRTNVSLSNVLNSLATSLTGTGYVIQDGPDSFVERSLATANSNHVTITNPSGVAGASTFDIGVNVYTNETHSLLNYLASSSPNLGEIPMGSSDNSYILTKPNAGAGVQLDFANGVFTISASGAGTGGGGGYSTVEEEGTPVTQRTTLNFVGAALTASDVSSKTQIAPHTSVNSIAVTPTNGQIPIGNGTNFTVGAPTAGQGVQITLGAGTLNIAASGAGQGYENKTASFTAVAGWSYGVDSSGGAVTVTLPTAVGCAGQEIFVSLQTAGNAMTFDTTSSQTIDGIASGALSTTVRYNSFTFKSNGSNWMLK